MAPRLAMARLERRSHADRMREHYSTVQPIVQRERIGRVLRLVTGGPVTDGNAGGGATDGAPTSRVVLREDGATG
jgi:hypothetical protein